MRKASIAFAAVAALALTGCAQLTGGRATPDEFAVARNAPLIIPPDFSLAPPIAGTQAISAGEAQQQAVDALFGGPAPRSAGEITLLDQAGRTDAPIGIRSTVWDPDTRIVDKGASTLRILIAPPNNSNVASAQVSG
jgi:hypothetical protein